MSQKFPVRMSSARGNMHLRPCDNGRPTDARGTADERLPPAAAHGKDGMSNLAHTPCGSPARNRPLSAFFGQIARACPPSFKRFFRALRSPCPSVCSCTQSRHPHPLPHAPFACPFPRCFAPGCRHVVPKRASCTFLLIPSRKCHIPLFPGRSPAAQAPDAPFPMSQGKDRVHRAPGKRQGRGVPKEGQSFPAPKTPHCPSRKSSLAPEPGISCPQTGQFGSWRSRHVPGWEIGQMDNKGAAAPFFPHFGRNWVDRVRTFAQDIFVRRHAALASRQGSSKSFRRRGILSPVPGFLHMPAHAAPGRTSWHFPEKPPIDIRQDVFSSRSFITPRQLAHEAHHERPHETRHERPRADHLPRIHNRRAQRFRPPDDARFDTIGPRHRKGHAASCACRTVVLWQGPCPPHGADKCRPEPQRGPKGPWRHAARIARKNAPELSAGNLQRGAPCRQSIRCSCRWTRHSP